MTTKQVLGGIKPPNTTLERIFPSGSFMRYAVERSYDGQA